MTSAPGFLKTLKTVAGKKLRGIRDSIPQGYILGRASSGNGPPELISMDSLLAGIKGIIGGIAANPTAIAGDVAVNGTATTFMRSDAAPAVQKTSSAQFGLSKVDGTTITAVGGTISTVNNGTVTSVGLTMPVEFTVTGSPVTSSGTLAVAKATQAANAFYAGPASGAAAAPAFRPLSVNDFVSLGFTNGSIPFMTPTGIAQDSGNFFFDVSAHTMTLKQGRIIIDGSNANQIFQFNSTGVQNSFWGVGNAISSNFTNTDAGVVIPGPGVYFLETNSTERLRIDGTGKVGIGASSPAILLDVNGPIGARVYTVATLPSAAARAGQFAFVNDATLTAITGLGLAPTGGGTNFVPVYSDGAGWKII